jgi:hypothetical protein
VKTEHAFSKTTAKVIAFFLFQEPFVAGKIAVQMIRTRVSVTFIHAQIVRIWTETAGPIVRAIVTIPLSDDRFKH